MSLDRTLAPSFLALDSINYAQASTHVLANGVSCHVIQTGTQPVISVELAFLACPDYDQLGTQSFVTAMLSEGTRRLNSAEWAEALEFYGAQIQVNFQYDRIVVALHTLTRFLPEILPLLVEMLTEPAFDPEELSLLQARRLEQHKINQKRPAFQAFCALGNVMWPNHPYGYRMGQADIENQSAEGLHRYFQHYLLGRPFEVIVSGLASDEHLKVISELLSQLDVSAGPLPAMPSLEAVPPVQVKSIVMPELVQDTLRLARHIIPKGHVHEHGLQVLNQAFGGYFGSRLMQNLREDKGYTYGIGCQYSHQPQGSLLVIRADLKSGASHDAREQIVLEMNRLIEEPLGENELDLVRNHMLGSLAGSINTPWDLADLFKSLHFFGLDYSYHQHFIDTIRHITATELQELAWHYLDPSKYSTVVVSNQPYTW